MILLIQTKNMASIKKSTSLCLAIMTLLFAGIVCAETRRIGVSAPLSGPGARWGNDLKNVLMFANDKLADGKYSFVFEDDRCDPKTSISVARKLITLDHAKEVFVMCGQTTIATAKVYRDANVTVMATLATPSRISELGVFRTGLSDSFAADKLASYILSAV